MLYQYHRLDTYQSTDNKRYTKPSPVLKKSEDMSACEYSEDESSDRSACDRGLIWPKDVFFFRCVRHVKRAEAMGNFRSANLTIELGSSVVS